MYSKFVAPSQHPESTKNKLSNYTIVSSRMKTFLERRNSCIMILPLGETPTHWHRSTSEWMIAGVGGCQAGARVCRELTPSRESVPVSPYIRYTSSVPPSAHLHYFWCIRNGGEDCYA